MSQDLTDRKRRTVEAIVLAAPDITAAELAEAADIDPHIALRFLNQYRQGQEGREAEAPSILPDSNDTLGSIRGSLSNVLSAINLETQAQLDLMRSSRRAGTKKPAGLAGIREMATLAGILLDKLKVLEGQEARRSLWEDIVEADDPETLAEMHEETRRLVEQLETRGIPLD